MLYTLKVLLNGSKLSNSREPTIFDNWWLKCLNQSNHAETDPICRLHPTMLDQPDNRLIYALLILHVTPLTCLHRILLKRGDDRGNTFSAVEKCTVWRFQIFVNLNLWRIPPFSDENSYSLEKCFQKLLNLKTTLKYEI